MNITLNFSANATNFIGGGGGVNPAPIFRFMVSDNESGSCPAGGLNTTLLSWTDVVENANIRICNGTAAQGMQYGATTDSLAIGIFVGIPSNAAGTKNVTIMAQGTS